MRGYIRGAALLLSVTLTACSGNGDRDGDGDDLADDTAAVPVEVAVPTRADITDSYAGTAPIEAFADVNVIAKVGGEITHILVEEGDDVVAGQTLARVDGDRLRLQVQQSEAQLEKLKRDYQRNLNLKDKSLISEGDFEKIRYEMEALEASHKMARLELSYTDIRTPIAGVVSERFIKLGNTIAASTAAFKVTSLEPLIAYLHVPEREYRRLAAGQTATLTVDALPDTAFTGQVARISPVVDSATGTFKLTIEVSDPTRRLKPGMFGRISIVSDRRENALQIPRSAIVDDGATAAVFVVEDGQAKRRVVQTGYAASGMVEILTGLADAERFVVVGQTGLKDGSIVNVINRPPVPDAQPGGQSPTSDSQATL